MIGDGSGSDGCWIAYFLDWSGFQIFRTEVDALRAAIGRYDGVAFVKWGQSPRKAVEAKYREKVGV